MGLYTVLKPFPRNEKGGGRITMRPGVRVRIELRSEAEDLLARGMITRDAAPIGAGAPITENSTRIQSIPKFTPEQIARIKTLAEKCGMPYAGAEAQILARMGEDTSAEQAINVFARIQGIVSAKELIEEAAELLGEPEAELQAEVFELAKEFKLSMADTIRRITLARKVKRPAKEVLAQIRDDVQQKSLTPQQVIAEIEKSAAPVEQKPQPDATLEAAGQTAAAQQAANEKAARDAREAKRAQKRGR